LDRVPYHAEYQKQLGEFVVSGSDGWTVHRIVGMLDS